MLRNREGRAMKIQNCMAILTSIPVWSRSELVVVSILVAIEASRIFHLVNGVFSGREMALPALHRNVFAAQRIAGRVVFLHPE